MLKLLDSLRLPRIGSDGDHPLASAREAAQIYTELRNGDPLKSVEEIADWLQSIPALDFLKPERRFEIVRDLDDLAQPHRAKLAREAATPGRGASARDARVWTLMQELWQRAIAAYLDLIARIDAKEKGSDALRKEVPLIALRALRAANLRLRALLLRYGPVPADLWVDVARAYRFAESRGQQLARVQVYTGVAGEACAEEELLRALLFAASAPDALTPPKIEIAERIVALLAAKFHLTLTPQPNSTYWFDLEAPRQPLRLAAPPAHITPGLRFFATATGHAEVQAMLERVEKAREVPRGVDLGGAASVEAVADVLRHLRQNWAPRPPVRRSERKRQAARIRVVHGLEAVVGCVRPAAPDLDFDLGEPPPAELWTVENQSGGGFGAVVEPPPADWLAIGALVALQPEGGAAHWDIGIVRRLAHVEGAKGVETRVGVQVLTRGALHGEFTTNIGRWAHGVATVEGAVIPEGGEAGAIMVALAHGLYLPGEQLLAMIAERPHLLFPIGLVERGADYDLIKFRAMVQET
ncbi:MAG: hypothetical protein JNM90_18525 [Burkholderiales bacterium]|nr:hypothetical protein [Burkholderiales bacterium]